MAEGASTSDKNRHAKVSEKAEDDTPLALRSELGMILFVERLTTAWDLYRNTLERSLGNPEVAGHIKEIRNDINIIEHSLAHAVVQGIKHPEKGEWMVKVLRSLARKVYYSPEIFSTLARVVAIANEDPSFDGKLGLEETVILATKLLDDVGDSAYFDQIAKARDRALRHKREETRKIIEAALGRRKGHNRPPLNSEREWERMYG